MTDELLILGDSPFLGEVREKVYCLLNKYDSVGINSVILKYPVKNHIFVDFPLLKITNKYPKVNRIAPLGHGDLVREPRELFTFRAFDSSIDDEKSIVKGTELSWCGFTHDFAITYAIYKAYKKVYLIGAADFIEGGHTVAPEKFTYSKVRREMSVRFIEEFCTKRLQVYTCNPSSCLKVPYVPVDELLT